MIKLVHLIYCSTATHPISDDELAALLDEARSKNIENGVTGILLYEAGGFFQVIEGKPDAIDELFRKIKQDRRHRNVVPIIHEPIVRRAFRDWTMGFSTLSATDVGTIVGSNDFFTEGSSLTSLDPGRAKKLLNAFKAGRWRARVRTEPAPGPGPGNQAESGAVGGTKALPFSCSFQPIVDAAQRKTIAYEAIPCRLNGGDLGPRESREYAAGRPGFEDEGRIRAFELARELGISCDLVFGIRAIQVADAPANIGALIDAARRFDISSERIVLKVNQERLIGEPSSFAGMIREFRAVGLRLAIDEFGSGRASLNLLAHYLPEYISLNELLVRDIESHGARQAIVLGVFQSCQDLGIEIIANHLRSRAEYDWFNEIGITLFQGQLIAGPAFEKLPAAVIPGSPQA